jgi:hypothetical protein
MGTQARAASWRRNTAEPPLGGGGYIEILGNLERADHKPIISQGWLGSFEGF